MLLLKYYRFKSGNAVNNRARRSYYVFRVTNSKSYNSLITANRAIFYSNATRRKVATITFSFLIFLIRVIRCCRCVRRAHKTTTRTVCGRRRRRPPGPRKTNEYFKRKKKKRMTVEIVDGKRTRSGKPREIKLKLIADDGSTFYD